MRKGPAPRNLFSYGLTDGRGGFGHLHICNDLTLQAIYIFSYLFLIGNRLEFKVTQKQSEMSNCLFPSTSNYLVLATQTS